MSVRYSCRDVSGISGGLRAIVMPNRVCQRQDFSLRRTQDTACFDPEMLPMLYCQLPVDEHEVDAVRRAARVLKAGVVLNCVC